VAAERIGSRRTAGVAITPIQRLCLVMTQWHRDVDAGVAEWLVYVRHHLARTVGQQPSRMPISAGGVTFLRQPNPSTPEALSLTAVWRA
jgi:hypothetical protein